MTHLREADRLRQARTNRRVAGRDRRDHYRAKAVARIVGVDWASLDEAAIRKWNHMAHEMTHLRLDAQWSNPLTIAVRMALQVEADPEELKALKEHTRDLHYLAAEHLLFLALGPACQLAWYTAALSVGEIFPSPSDRVLPASTDRCRGCSPVA